MFERWPLVQRSCVYLYSSLTYFMLSWIHMFARVSKTSQFILFIYDSSHPVLQHLQWKVWTVLLKIGFPAGVEDMVTSVEGIGTVTTAHVKKFLF